MSKEDGKYVLMKDPNKPIVSGDGDNNYDDNYDDNVNDDDNVDDSDDDDDTIMIITT
jgi:hypothetical protein